LPVRAMMMSTTVSTASGGSLTQMTADGRHSGKFPSNGAPSLSPTDASARCGILSGRCSAKYSGARSGPRETSSLIKLSGASLRQSSARCTRPHWRRVSGTSINSVENVIYMGQDTPPPNKQLALRAPTRMTATLLVSASTVRLCPARGVHPDHNNRSC
jgi:hypothetical protein